jgi:hypothetical protein
MARRRPIRALSAAGLAVLCVTLGAAAAAATPRDSLKLVLPKHLHTGMNATLVLAGYASGTKPEVSLFSQPQPCASTFTAEVKFHNLTIWVEGGHVKDHQYRYKDPVGFSKSTRGSQNFCAYLTSFSSTFSYITEAHETVRFNVSG